MTDVLHPAASSSVPASSISSSLNPAPSPSSSPSSAAASSTSASPLSSLSPNESVWQSLLQRSSRRKDLLPPSTLVVLGDAHSGKSTLLAHLDSATTAAASQTATAAAASGYVVEYGYVSVRRRDVVDKEEVLGRLNVWSLDDDKQAAALVPQLIQSALPTPAVTATAATSASTLAHSNSTSASATSAASAASSPASSSLPSAAYTAYSTTAFLVCVDLSEPARLSEQLQRWHHTLLAIRDAAFHHMSKSERAALLHATSLHTQSYYNKDLLTLAPASAASAATAAAGSEGEAVEAAATEVNPHVPEVNYGAAVVVVGTKADVLLSGGGGEVRSGWGGGLSGDERLEFAVWLMRHAALQSASTLYLSALPSTAASTVDTLQSYLYHHLYHFPLSAAAATPQPLPALLPQPTLVPSGYDSAELIEASQVKEGRWKAGMRSDEVFERRRGDTAGGGGRAAWRETRGVVVKSVDDSVLFKNIKVQLEGNTSVQLLPPLSASPAAAASAAATSGSKPPRVSAAREAAAGATESPGGSHPSSPTSRSKKNKLNPQGQVAVKAFFKSLLQQPGGGSGGAGAAAGAGVGGGGEALSKRSSMRKDAELELKRISEAAAAGRADKDKADRGEQKE